MHFSICQWLRVRARTTRTSSLKNRSSKHRQTHGQKMFNVLFFFLLSIPSTVSSVRLVIIKKDTVGKAVHLYLPATPYSLFPYWVLKAGWSKPFLPESGKSVQVAGLLSEVINTAEHAILSPNALGPFPLYEGNSGMAETFMKMKAARPRAMVISPTCCSEFLRYQEKLLSGRFCFRGWLETSTNR